MGKQGNRSIRVKGKSLEKIVLLDTNILIEILKANQTTIREIKNINTKFAISSISKMELFYGALNKQELKKLKEFTNTFIIIDINEQISLTATNLIFSYAKSHNLDIPDALIASTALYYDIKLFTYNLKDFQYIENLKLIK